MADHTIRAGSSTPPGGAATVEISEGRRAGARRLASIVLLDHVAAFLGFVAAGGYLALKALNDRHSALMRVIEQVTVLFYSLGIHELPGLPDYPTLRQFGIQDFADFYLIAMAALHVLATAGLLPLARGLSLFRPWARRAHLLVAAVVLLILGVYASVYARSDAPPVGLAVMATVAFVPSAVIAILLAPRIASLFREGARPGPHLLADREDAPPRIALGLTLGLYMIVVLTIVAIASGPVAIRLWVALHPTP